MLRDKALPWYQRHRKLITLSTIAALTTILFIYGIIHATPEEFTISFALPASYTLFALIPGYFIVETVGKGLLKLKERINYGLEHKTILLAGDKSECDNIEEQLRYSQLFDKKNITNISTDRMTAEQAYTSDNFNKYDLIILCFTGTNHTPISDQQAQLLSETLSNIGNDERVKNHIKASNSEGTAVGSRKAQVGYKSIHAPFHGRRQSSRKATDRHRLTPDDPSATQWRVGRNPS